MLSVLKKRVSASGIVLKRQGFGGGEQAEVHGRGAENEAVHAGV